MVRTECLLGDQKKINENTNNEYSKSHIKKYILKWNKVRLKDRKLSKKVTKSALSLGYQDRIKTLQFHTAKRVRIIT